MALVTTTILADECNYGFTGNAVDHKDDPTMIVDADPGVNGDETIAFVSFPLAGSIPVGTTLVKAQLKLYMEEKASVADNTICLAVDQSDSYYPLNYQPSGSASSYYFSNGSCGKAEGWKIFDIINPRYLETDADGQRRLTFRIRPTKFTVGNANDMDSRTFRTEHYGDGSFAPQLILTHDEAVPVGIVKLKDGINEEYKLYDPLDVAGNQLRIKTPDDIGCLPLVPATADTPLRIHLASGSKGIQPYREKRSETLEQYDRDNYSGSWASSSTSFSAYSVKPWELTEALVDCVALKLVVNFEAISASTNMKMWVHTQGGSWAAVSGVVTMSQTDKGYLLEATFSKRTIDAVACAPDTNQGTRSWTAWYSPFGAVQEVTKEYEF